MSDTYFDINDFEYQQDLQYGITEELRELTPEEFSCFLCCGSLDRDIELN